MEEQAKKRVTDEESALKKQEKRLKARFISAIVFTAIATVCFIAMMVFYGKAYGMLQEKIKKIDDLKYLVLIIISSAYLIIAISAFFACDIVALALSVSLLKYKDNKKVFYFGVAATILTAAMMITVVAIVAAILNGAANREVTLAFRFRELI